MVTKVTYVGEGFTRKPPKFERFIRPMVCTIWQPCLSIHVCSFSGVGGLVDLTFFCFPGSKIQEGSCNTPRGESL